MGEPLTVGALEGALLAVFPREDAADWDRTGLLLGDPGAEVGKVAVALDPTVAAISEAAERGCNVLVTHHPPYLDAPDLFQPADSVARVNGAGVFEAARRGVALMNFHTALDFNPRGWRRMPQKLGFACSGVLQPMGGSTGENGYGALCEAPAGATVGDVARRCAEAFGTRPASGESPRRPPASSPAARAARPAFPPTALRAGWDAWCAGR